MNHRVDISERFPRIKQKDSKVALLALAFASIVFIFSWHSDDAYHSYVMARNLVWGNGLVYNVGYRVNASTCPLFTMLQALFYFLFRNMELGSTILSTICATLAAYFLFKHCCKNLLYSMLGFICMFTSHSFMSFTASGLENPLLYLLGVIFICTYVNHEFYDQKQLFIIAILTSLLAMTRMDIVIIFIPMILLIFLIKTKVKFIKRVFIGLAGLMPFILWCLFSLFYYGFIFPNTFYAKLNVDIPTSEFIQRGLNYIEFSFAYDLILAIVPLSLLLITIKIKNTKNIALLIGILMYYSYVIYIGGDFMVGRHLTVPFILSLATVFLSANTNLIHDNSNRLFIYSTIALAVICIILNMSFSKFIKSYFYSRTGISSITCAEDEMEYYSNMGLSTKNILVCQLTKQSTFFTLYNEDHIDQINDCKELKYSGIAFDDYILPGYVVYNTHDKTDPPFYLTDNYGLMDAYVVRMPIIYDSNWRTGHIQRLLPVGFEETITTGVNVIEDPELHEYYDLMNTITSGDLFSRERIETIINMNLGRYDYLLS